MKTYTLQLRFINTDTGRCFDSDTYTGLNAWNTALAFDNAYYGLDDLILAIRDESQGATLVLLSNYSAEPYMIDSALSDDLNGYLYASMKGRLSESIKTIA